jgi:hypothetical protein
MKQLRIALLALCALATPVYAQGTLPPLNLACGFKINGTTAGCPLGVAVGGTGAATLTGIVKGNGTSPFTAAASGTDYVAPSRNISTSGSLTGGGNLSADRTLAYGGDGAWTAYTPTVVGGTPPTTATAAGSYKQLGSKTYVFHLTYDVSVVGSPGAGINLSLPNAVTPVAAVQACTSAASVFVGIFSSINALYFAPQAWSATSYDVTCGPFEVN